MIDKPIDALPSAQSITPDDLFVLKQADAAKKLPGRVLLAWLTAVADGHGGIQAITMVGKTGRVTTYRITLADGTHFDFNVTDGSKGDKGDPGTDGSNAYVWIRWAAQQPSAVNPDISATPGDWMGIYSGSAATAPTNWQEYMWYKVRGATGAPAVIVSSSVSYQSSPSGTAVPTGEWSAAIPSVQPGKYLWTKITTVYNTGDSVVAYSVARMGIDGIGNVYSVAGILPDESGNVSILDVVYPVGAIYLSAVATSPATLFGGTWERIQDRFLLAAGSDYAAGSQGGEAEHTLTTPEIPSHTHSMGKRLLSWDSSDPNKLAVAQNTASPLSIYTDYQKISTTSVAGGGSAHNNMPPYLAVYVWKRTA